MGKLAIIGGTGLSEIAVLDSIEKVSIETPFGHPSAALSEGKLNGNSVLFLPRHGEQHTIAPHRINYRANLWALRALGVTDIIAVAVGSRVASCAEDDDPGRLVIWFRRIREHVNARLPGCVK